MFLYRPNKNNTGHSLALSFNSKDESFFISIAKQNGFSEGGKGKFTGGKKCLVCLGKSEIGGILYVISGLKESIYKNEKATLCPSRYEQDYFHQSAKQTVKLKFSPYLDKQTNIVKGLNIWISHTDKETGESTSYTYGAPPDEFTLLEEYLKFVLTHFFSAAYSAEKKKREEALKNKGVKPEKVKETEKDKPAQKIVEEVDGTENW